MTTFDADPSLRHRDLFNKVMEEIGFKGVTWCADFGEPHEIDDPRDICLTPEAAFALDWDGTSYIENSYDLLSAIATGIHALEQKRRDAVNLSVSLLKDVTSKVDISHLTPAEKEVVGALMRLKTGMKFLDIDLKDLRGKGFWDNSLHDEASVKQFWRLSANVCFPGIARVNAGLVEYCSPVDYFPNKRPDEGTYTSTELVPDDMTQAEMDALIKAAPDPIWNPYVVSYTSLMRDPTWPLGFKWTAFGVDPRFAELSSEIAGGILKIADEYGMRPSLRSELRAVAHFMTSPDPFVAYDADRAWADQTDGNLEVVIGPVTGYAPHGKLSTAKLFIGVERPAETKFLKTYLVPYLQAFEDFSASLIGQGYSKRPLEKNAPVRVVDAICNEGIDMPATTLAFFAPDKGLIAREGKGKRIVIANHHEAKFNVILKPLAELAMVPEQLGYIDPNNFIMNGTAHEVTHGVGPRSDKIVASGKMAGKKASDAIGEDAYSTIEEARADLGAIVFLKFLRDLGIKKPDGTSLVDEEFLKRSYITYAASLLRQMRFGSKGHGGGAWTQMNNLFSVGAVKVVSVKINGKTESRVEVNLDKMPKAIERLYAKIGQIEHKGDAVGAEKLLTGTGKIPDLVEKEILKRVNSAGIPVDVEIHYETVDSNDPYEDMMGGEST